MYTTYEYKEKCGIFGRLAWLAAITSPPFCVYIFWVALKDQTLGDELPKILIPIVLLLIFLTNILIAMAASMFAVKIEDNILSLIYGNGIFRKKIDTREIKTVKQFKTKYQIGLFGKKISSDTKLYSVGNKNIVELELHSGKKFQIGTNQPDQLTQAIKSVIG